MENFRVDQDAKVVSQEVYDYLKQRHGVLKDPGTGAEDEGQDIYRLRNPDCADWQRELRQRYNFDADDDVVRMLLQVPIESEKELPDSMLLFDKDGGCNQLPERQFKPTTISHQPIAHNMQANQGSSFKRGINGSSSSSESTPRAGRIDSVVDTLDSQPTRVT